MSRCQGLAAITIALMGAWPVAAWSQIEEIVVTTRKKEEKLQDVPIAVSAISEEQISRQGVADLEDVVRNTPSVQFDRAFGPSDTRVTIRGLSNTRGRSNVAFLVDGVDVTTENLIFAGSGLLANRRLLSDVQRIEIVKGPQSALYGRAAFAGAINYITKEPGDYFEGSSKIDFADDGFQQVEAAFGGPVIDDLFGVRMTGFWYNQDGHYDNAISGNEVGGSGGSGAAMTAVIRPNDVTKIKVRGEYSQEDFDPLPNVRIGGGWENGQGVQLYEYPEGIIQHARNILTPGSTLSIASALGTSANNIGLVDFNQYCPPELKDPSRGPGFCLPSDYGNASGRVVRHSENPLTGSDFDGTDTESFRLSLIADFDLDGGLLTSYTGWTNFDSTDAYDQDWQAAGADYSYAFGPAPGSSDGYLGVPWSGSGRVPDQLLGQQVADTNSEVEQLSQELRFSSRLDGPMQYTVGALYWDEVRQLFERNAILLCLPVTKTKRTYDPVTDTFTYPEFYYQPGLCDGRAGSLGQSVQGWQAYWQQLQPVPSAYWRAETRHWSFYAKMEFELAEAWKLEIEDRFVSEHFRLNKPAKPLCTSLAATATSSIFRLETPTDPVGCEFETVVTQPEKIVSETIDYQYLQASESSHFDTPKITLNWKPTADSLIYAFWARAQKPAGINQLTGGGTNVVASQERFDAEKLESWELGTKNKFYFLGTLFANASFFFQDYTDKQVSIQRIDEAGVLRPVVTNASGAEVWGSELELTWAPDAVEGLTLNAAYTYLDATYTKFEEDFTSLLRIANIGECDLVYRGNVNGFLTDIPLTDPTTADPRINSAFCRIDLAGNQLERTPEHAVALGASYVRPLLDTGLDLLVEGNANWTDKRYLDQDNTIYFEPYWMVDLRVGLLHPKYEIVAYVDNVFDDDTIRSGGSGPDFGRQATELGFSAGLGVGHYFGTLPDPRIFGVRATYRFGDE